MGQEFRQGVWAKRPGHAGGLGSYLLGRVGIVLPLDLALAKLLPEGGLGGGVQHLLPG